MDKILPAPTTERREMQLIGRSLDDTPDIGGIPRDIVRPMLWAALGLSIMIAFMGWLLLGSPPR